MELHDGGTYIAILFCDLGCGSRCETRGGGDIPSYLRCGDTVEPFWSIDELQQIGTKW